jgi:hypothetical protein
MTEPIKGLEDYVLTLTANNLLTNNEESAMQTQRLANNMKMFVDEPERLRCPETETEEEKQDRQYAKRLLTEMSVRVKDSHWLRDDIQRAVKSAYKKKRNAGSSSDDERAPHRRTVRVTNVEVQNLVVQEIMRNPMTPSEYVARGTIPDYAPSAPPEEELDRMNV